MTGGSTKVDCESPDVIWSQWFQGCSGDTMSGLGGQARVGADSKRTDSQRRLYPQRDSVTVVVQQQVYW